MELQSGFKYTLKSTADEIPAVFVSCVYQGDNAWYKFFVNSGDMYFIRVGEYLCHPRGNFKVVPK